MSNAIGYSQELGGGCDSVAEDPTHSSSWTETKQAGADLETPLPYFLAFRNILDQEDSFMGFPVS